MNKPTPTLFPCPRCNGTGMTQHGLCHQCHGVTMLALDRGKIRSLTIWEERALQQQRDELAE